MPTLTQNSGGATATELSELAASQWLPDLFCCLPAHSGRAAGAGGWRVKIEASGRDHVFALRAESKDAAAEEARTIHGTVLTEGWDTALRKYPGLNQAGSNSSPDAISYWKERLFVRRYRFPGTDGADTDWAVKIEHEGTGYWFPLGTSNPDAAARKARLIYQAVLAHGWETAGSRFSRELIVNFEWSANPILWTYTTIHTLVESSASKMSSASPNPGFCRAIVLEPDAGIR